MFRPTLKPKTGRGVSGVAMFRLTPAHHTREGHVDRVTKKAHMYREHRFSFQVKPMDGPLTLVYFLVGR